MRSRLQRKEGRMLGVQHALKAEAFRRKAAMCNSYAVCAQSATNAGQLLRMRDRGLHVPRTKRARRHAAAASRGPSRCPRGLEHGAGRATNIMNGTAVRESVQSIKDAPFDFTAAASCSPAAIARTSARSVTAIRHGRRGDPVRHRELPARCSTAVPGGGGSAFRGGRQRALYERADYPLNRAARTPEGEPEI